MRPPKEQPQDTAADLPHRHTAPTHTEADETSYTRFGPRPVPDGHRNPARDPEARRIPPHGDVSPDGRHVWPRPSRSAKWLAWGGTGLAAAALTAGTVLAARHIIDMLSDDGDRPPRSGQDKRQQVRAPRFADLDAAERDAMRRRVAEQDEADDRRARQLRADAEAARVRARPSRKRRRMPRQSLIKEIEANTASLNRGVGNVTQSLGAALEGFRGAARQASAIVEEFGDTALLLRGIISGQPGSSGQPQPRGTAAPQPRRERGAHPDAAAPHMPDLRDDPLVGPTPDGRQQGGPLDHDPRIHSL